MTISHTQEEALAELEPLALKLAKAFNIQGEELFKDMLRHTVESLIETTLSIEGN